MAHLLDKKAWGPYLIVAPLSTLSNWIDEFQKFAPSIPVCMYHGTKEHREELRRTVLRPPLLDDDDQPILPSKIRGRGRSRGGKQKGKKSTSADDADYTPVDKDKFPVVVTTYDIIIRDSQYLSRLVPNKPWEFIIVDEGHRLKNMDCRCDEYINKWVLLTCFRLMRELKTYPSKHRLLLTGTPLHNNLAEYAKSSSWLRYLPQIVQVVVTIELYSSRDL